MVLLGAGGHRAWSRSPLSGLGSEPPSGQRDGMSPSCQDEAGEPALRELRIPTPARITTGPGARRWNRPLKPQLRSPREPGPPVYSTPARGTERGSWKHCREIAKLSSAGRRVRWGLTCWTRAWGSAGLGLSGPRDLLSPADLAGRHCRLAWRVNRDDAGGQEWATDPIGPPPAVLEQWPPAPPPTG